MKIGNIDMPYGIMLAPMAGYSDRAMRVICHGLGAEYSVTEMISAKAVVFGDKKTLSLAAIHADEGPVGLQLFGSEPETVARAAAIMSRGIDRDGCVPPAAIDINMGCPVNKIFGNGEGSALMRSPSLIHDIVRATTEATDLPVTVKLRVGIDDRSINATECALAAEEGGAAMICMHGRTRVDMYSGEVRREVLREVKKSLRIPFIANGDIICPSDALSMLSDTGADGIAIGRGAVGNPFIFSQIRAILSGGEPTCPTLREQIELALCQLRISVEEKGERVAVQESRKQIALYLHAFRGAAALRAKINSATTYREVEHILLSALDAES